MKSKIQEILKLSTETLEKLSDDGLKKLLGPLVPQSRVSNKDEGADDLARSLALAEKLMKSMNTNK